MRMSFCVVTRRLLDGSLLIADQVVKETAERQPAVD